MAGVDLAAVERLDGQRAGETVSRQWTRVPDWEDHFRQTVVADAARGDQAINTDLAGRRHRHHRRDDHNRDEATAARWLRLGVSRLRHPGSVS